MEVKTRQLYYFSLGSQRFLRKTVKLNGTPCICKYIEVCGI